MGEYNPHAPIILGQEWVPILNEPITMETATEVGHSFTLSQQVTVDTGRFYVKEPPLTKLTNQRSMVYVYPKGEECNTGPIRKIVVPVNGVVISGATCENNSCVEALKNPSDDSFIEFNNSNGGANNLFLNFNTQDYSEILTDKRITNITLLVSAIGSFELIDGLNRLFAFSIGNSAFDNLDVLVAGTLTDAPSNARTSAKIQRVSFGEVSAVWEPSLDFTNNEIVLPWSYNELERMDERETINNIGILIQSILPSDVTEFGLYPELHYAALEISYCDELRVAYGGKSHFTFEDFESPGYPFGSNEMPLFDPSARTRGATLDPDEYTVVATIADAGGNANFIFNGNAGDKPVLFAARQLYPMPDHSGIIITKSNNTEYTTPRCDETNVLPQLSLHELIDGGFDTFDRDSAAGWGVSSDGTFTWEDTGAGGTVAATDFTVESSSGQGFHYVPVANAYRESFMTPGGVGARDAEAFVVWRVNIADITGGSIEPGNITFRRASGFDWILCRISITSSEEFVLSIHHVDDGQMGDAVTIDIGSWTPNQFYRVRARIIDKLVMMRVWFTTDPEPEAWHIIRYSENINTNENIGDVSIRSGVDGLNTNTKPIEFKYSQFQVYNIPTVQDVHAYGSQFENEVHGSIVPTQEIINDADSVVEYPWVRFYARRFGNTTDPLELYDESNTSITTQISVADFDALPEITNGWKEVTLRFTENVPTFDSSGAISTYAWSSSGTSSNDQWQILGATAAVDVLDPYMPYGDDPTNPTYGGTDAVAERTNPRNDIATEMWEDPRSDYTILFAQDMPQVTGFGISQETQPVSGIGIDCGIAPECIPTGVYYHHITWSPISVTGNSFGLYELQRYDDYDDEWSTIMEASSPFVTGFSDYEARIGIESIYRIRACSVYDFCGSWSATVSNTITAPGVDIGTNDAYVLTFTSSEHQNGSSTLAYSPVWDGDPNQDFTFPEADTQILQRMYGKNYFTAFRPLERGGVQFSRTLLLQAAAVDPPVLERIAKSLRDLAWADLPYVCVRTNEGDRWYANVSVPSGNVRRRRQLQMAQVNITQVTDTANIVVLPEEELCLRRDHQNMRNHLLLMSQIQILILLHILVSVQRHIDLISLMDQRIFILALFIHFAILCLR